MPVVKLKSPMLCKSHNGLPIREEIKNKKERIKEEIINQIRGATGISVVLRKTHRPAPRVKVTIMGLKIREIVKNFSSFQKIFTRV